MGDYAGAWLRVSTGGQDEANQEPDVMGWITGHGYELRKTYRLHGKSATKGQQQHAIEEMLADIRAGVITVLAVWAADRIERRGALAALTLAEQVRQAGGRIEYVRDAHLNAANDMSDVMLSLAATMARQETRRKKERVAVAHDRSRAGGALTGRAVWGYDIDGEKYAKRLVPSEDGKRLVPGVFRRVIAGDSLATIAAWLDQEAPRPRRQWWPRTIAGMIRNPVYRGVQQNAAGQVIHRVADPLVDARTWKLANDALDNRPGRGPVNPATRAMLSGVLECASCRAAGVTSPMYRIKAGHGNTHLYYRCTGKGPGRRGCGTMVRLDAADAAVDRLIATRFDKHRTEYTVIEGNEAGIAARLQANEYERAQLGLAGLDDEAEDRRRAELRAERDAIRAEPVVPDRVEETDTGERYADLWARTPVPERGPWLAANGFRVYASRARVTIEHDAGTHEASL
jgi:DNA invertase Pin-like site-specific DNA recombinase